MSKGISETAFLSQLLDLLKLFGWKYEHTFEQRIYARRTSKGFPDIVAVRPPRLIFAELKSEAGKVTTEQETWLEDLKECMRMITLVPMVSGKKLPLEPLIPSFEVYLWRPSQLESEIMEVLR